MYIHSLVLNVRNQLFNFRIFKRNVPLGPAAVEVKAEASRRVASHQMPYLVLTPMFALRVRAPLQDLVYRSDVQN